MSEKGKNKQPEVYEFMDPGARFVSLSREIMRQHHQDPDADLDEGAISVTWPAPEKSDYYRLQKDYIQNRRGTVLVAYILEHFSANYSSSKPFRRYFVAADESKDTVPTSKIFQIDQKNLPMTHNGPDMAGWQRDIAKTALRTLGAQAPDFANKLINQRFNHYFDAAAADYILSDYALEGVDQELTTDIAHQSISKFRERMQKISDSVIKKSKKHGPNGQAPTAAYADAVSEAANRPREADGRNRYRIVEYGKVVLDTAKEIKKWQHRVGSLDTSGKEKGMGI